jgi:hypothetical protein
MVEIKSKIFGPEPENNTEPEKNLQFQVRCIIAQKRI